ncbi:MAG: YihY/virulence factor BrkB family protein [Vicinamibacteria bacterium]|nr:YihY/virulence factor BrkB family protein [Vicinamibacteria bacterium]
MEKPSPRRPLTLKDVRLLIDKSVNAWVDDYAPSMGAAIAYYTLFSLAPLLILLVALAGMFFGREAAQGEIMAQLQGRIGPEAASAVQNVLKSLNGPAQSLIASAVGLVTLLFGATSVFGELQSALNRIWRVPEPASSSGLMYLVRSRLLSFAMLLGIGFLLLLSLALGTSLSVVADWSDAWFGGRRGVLQAANSLISFAINIGLFAALYKFIPRARVNWRDVGVGALVTALLYELGKQLIGLYLGRSTVGSGFGAAGSLLVFLVWVYYSAQVFLLGAEFTWVYSHQRGSRVERFQTKAVPVVPTRLGDATPEAKAEETHRPTSSYPLTARYASAAAAKVKSGALGAGRFIKRQPLVGLGLLVGVGAAVAVAAILRTRDEASDSTVQDHSGSK